MNKRLLEMMILFLLTGFAREAGAQKVMPSQKTAPSQKEVLDYMKMAADWQLANPTGKPLNQWEYGPFYQGVMKLYALSKKAKYYDAVMTMGDAVHWEPLPRPYDANSLAIVSAFADLYAFKKDPKILDKSRFMMDMPVARKLFALGNRKDTLASLVNHKDNIYQDEWWTWCDALFMAPPAFAQLSVLLDKPEYKRFMIKNWWLTSDYLYSKGDSLFFRDDGFFNQRTVNGKKIFWARGNGWVVGGLCGVMNELKKNDPERRKFEQQFVEMCAKLSELQMENGCWSQSLLDSVAYPQKETSGTAFYCYGLAWGINDGLLSRDKYLPLVLKAWQALTSSVNADGKLGYVQKVGDKPDNVKAEDSETYGTGAFLLAGSEVYKLFK